jgi:isocitrate dehydrogenase
MDGSKITMTKDGIKVPFDPIIPFIEGDGTGPDIWAASVRVFDALSTKPIKAPARSIGKKYWQEKKPLSFRQLASAGNA